MILEVFNKLSCISHSYYSTPNKSHLKRNYVTLEYKLNCVSTVLDRFLPAGSRGVGLLAVGSGTASVVARLVLHHLLVDEFLPLVHSVFPLIH